MGSPRGSGSRARSLRFRGRYKWYMWGRAAQRRGICTAPQRCRCVWEGATRSPVAAALRNPARPPPPYPPPTPLLGFRTHTRTRTRTGAVMEVGGIIKGVECGKVDIGAISHVVCNNVQNVVHPCSTRSSTWMQGRDERQGRRGHLCPGASGANRSSSSKALGCQYATLAGGSEQRRSHTACTACTLWPSSAGSASHLAPPAAPARTADLRQYQTAH